MTMMTAEKQTDKPARECKNKCGRMRSGDRSLCKECDEQRRLLIYGICPRCQLRAIKVRGLCDICDQRERRSRQLEAAFNGNVLNRDDFVHLVESMIERLTAALRKNHGKYEQYMQSGTGYADPDVIQIQTILFTIRDLRSNQYNYVIRMVNCKLQGLYTLPLEYTKDKQ